MVHEKGYAPPYLQFAFEVDGSESADVTFTQAVRLTLMDVAGYRSECEPTLCLEILTAFPVNLQTADRHQQMVCRASCCGQLLAIQDFSAFRSARDYGRNDASIGADIGYGFNRSAKFVSDMKLAISMRASVWTTAIPFHLRAHRKRKLHFLVDHADDR